MASTTTNYGFPYPQDPDPVDVAGDLQGLAEDIDDKLGEIVADTVGLMVNSNTENGISVTYDDSDNTLDFDVDDFDIVLSGDVSGSATVTNLASVTISASVADNSHNHVSSNITDFQTTVEEVIDAFNTIDVPSGTDPVATLYNDTLTITENNGILVTGTGSNTVDISTNATPLNTASALVSRDSEKTFDITGIDFDTSASATTQVGRLAWDDGEGTLKVNLKGGNVDLDIGQENVVICYNGSGSAMSIGDVVYIQGAQGQRPDITLASASSESSSSKTLGIVAEAISAGNEGFVTTFGVVKNVNTFGFTEGAALWLSATAGEFTETPPTTPDHLVFIGYCLKASSSAGRIFVEPQNGYEIEELHNVLITSASAGDVLTYNSASSIWINESFDERAQDAIATMISNGTQTNLTIDYDDNANSLSFNVIGAVADVQGTTNEIEVTSASNIYTVGLPDDVIITNDLTVSGNLTVSGSTTYINTTELLVEDNLVTLNSGTSGSPTLNAGIEIERGSELNTAIRWNETTDVWEFTNDGTTYSELGSGSGGAAVRYQPDETPGTVAGELWVDSDGTSSLVNANDYLTKTDAASLYADRTPFQSASPSLPDDGQLWVDSDDNTLYVYGGSASGWITVSSAAAGGGGGASKSSILFLAGM